MTYSNYLGFWSVNVAQWKKERETWKRLNHFWYRATIISMMLLLGSPLLINQTA